MPTAPNSFLALDVGEKRVGVAVASRAARLPRPLTTLNNDGEFFSWLAKIVDAENVDTIIVGLPRGLSGQHTGQTAAVESFAERLREEFQDTKVHFQDEALTSRKAEAELQQRNRAYQKSDVDALAAVYILEDWLASQPLTSSEVAP
jgi:putative pre-16S rRNA nuclease